MSELKKFEKELDYQLSNLAKSEKKRKISALRKELDKYNEKFLNKHIEELFNLGFKNQREIALIGMLVYLWEYEARYHFLVNILCFVLTINGEKIVVNQKTRKTINCNSFSEVEKVGIHNKIEFLKENGFKIMELNDNNLRNDIAHYNFLIDEDGTVKFYKSNGKLVKEVIHKRHEDMLDLLSEVFPSFWNYLKEYDIYPYDTPLPPQDFSP